MLFVFLIQGNMYICVKYLWRGKQESEGWEEGQWEQHLSRYSVSRVS